MPLLNTSTKMNIKRHLPLAVCSVLLLTSITAFGQKVELHAYAGGFFPTTTNEDMAVPQ
jgi:hypothetical protein